MQTFEHSGNKNAVLSIESYFGGLALIHICLSLHLCSGTTHHNQRVKCVYSSHISAYYYTHSQGIYIFGRVANFLDAAIPKCCYCKHFSAVLYGKIPTD